MKKAKEGSVKKVLNALPKILLVGIFAVGILLAALVEANVVTVRQIEQFFNLIDENESIPASTVEELPEKALSFCVTAVDVGHGDCIIIEVGEKTVMIDCGEYEHFADVDDFMHYRSITSLDMIIVTHQHTDHMGGMSEVIDKYGAGRIIVPDVPDDMIPPSKAYERFLMSAQDKGIRLTPAVAGYVYKLTEINGLPVTMSVLYPLPGEHDDLNDYSVCTRLDYGNISWLFTGDLTEKGEELLVRSGADIDVSALKVGHHGSSGSSGRLFLSRVSPSLAVISCGKDNDYGHPSEEALKRISRYTDRIYRTDEYGDISVYSDGKKLYVKKEK